MKSCGLRMSGSKARKGEPFVRAHGLQIAMREHVQWTSACVLGGARLRRRDVDVGLSHVIPNQRVSAEHVQRIGLAADNEQRDALLFQPAQRLLLLALRATEASVPEHVLNDP